MHVESPSTMFGATMCYVALRLLGVARDEECMALGRAFLHAHGGCTYTGSWAKFYLCLLGAMEWAGHQVTDPSPSPHPALILSLTLTLRLTLTSTLTRSSRPKPGCSRSGSLSTPRGSGATAEWSTYR